MPPKITILDQSRNYTGPTVPANLTVTGDVTSTNNNITNRLVVGPYAQSEARFGLSTVDIFHSVYANNEGFGEFGNWKNIVSISSKIGDTVKRKTLSVGRLDGTYSGIDMSLMTIQSYRKDIGGWIPDSLSLSPASGKVYVGGYPKTVNEFISDASLHVYGNIYASGSLSVVNSISMGQTINYNSNFYLSDLNFGTRLSINSKGGVSVGKFSENASLLMQVQGNFAARQYKNTIVYESGINHLGNNTQRYMESNNFVSYDKYIGSGIPTLIGVFDSGDTIPQFGFASGYEDGSNSSPFPMLVCGQGGYIYAVNYERIAVLNTDAQYGQKINEGISSYNSSTLIEAHDTNPSGSYLYFGEDGGIAVAHLSGSGIDVQYRIDLRTDPANNVATDHIKVHPSEKYLIVSCREMNATGTSVSYKINVYGINNNANLGVYENVLTLIYTYDCGQKIDSIAIHPNGRYMCIVKNSASNLQNLSSPSKSSQILTFKFSDDGYFSLLQTHNYENISIEQIAFDPIGKYLAVIYGSGNSHKYVTNPSTYSVYLTSTYGAPISATPATYSSDPGVLMYNVRDRLVYKETEIEVSKIASGATISWTSLTGGNPTSATASGGTNYTVGCYLHVSSNSLAQGWRAAFIVTSINATTGEVTGISYSSSDGALPSSITNQPVSDYIPTEYIFVNNRPSNKYTSGSGIVTGTYQFSFARYMSRLILTFGDGNVVDPLTEVFEYQEGNLIGYLSINSTTDQLGMLPSLIVAGWRPPLSAPAQMIFHPSGKYVYIPSAGNIYIYQIYETDIDYIASENITQRNYNYYTTDAMNDFLLTTHTRGMVKFIGTILQESSDFGYYSMAISKDGMYMYVVASGINSVGSSSSPSKMIFVYSLNNIKSSSINISKWIGVNTPDHQKNDVSLQVGGITQSHQYVKSTYPTISANNAISPLSNYGTGALTLIDTKNLTGLSNGTTVIKVDPISSFIYINTGTLNGYIKWTLASNSSASIVDGNTGVPAVGGTTGGQPFPVTDVAIDPLGRFVAFSYAITTSNSNQYGVIIHQLSNLFDTVAYQKIIPITDPIISMAVSASGKYLWCATSQYICTVEILSGHHKYYGLGENGNGPNLKLSYKFSKTNIFYYTNMYSYISKIVSNPTNDNVLYAILRSTSSLSSTTLIGTFKIGSNGVLYKWHESSPMSLIKDMVCDPLGRFLYTIAHSTTNIGTATNLLRIHLLNSEGTPASSGVRNMGSGLQATKISVDASGKYVFVTSLLGVIRQFIVHPVGGTNYIIQPPLLNSTINSTGTEIYAVECDSSGKHVYVSSGTPASSVYYLETYRINNFGANSGTFLDGVTLGYGQNSSTPIGSILRGPSAGTSYTDIVGGNITIAAGAGTGTGGSGSIIFQTAPSGTSGTTQNTLSEVMRINPSGIIVQSKTPAFYVTHSNNTLTIGTIIWGNTGYNNGNHYNTSTGKFTAPVAGYYFFRAHTLINSSSAGETRMAVYVNSGKYSGSEFIQQKVANTWNTLSCQAHCYLAANDTVHIYMVTNPGTLHSDAGYNSFSGHLIG